MNMAVLAATNGKKGNTMNNPMANYRDQALSAKRKELSRQMKMIAEIPGNVLMFLDAMGITSNLSELDSIVKDEMRRRGLQIED
jgi:hypothetical protein